MAGIFLRASGIDSGAGAGGFVGIPVPLGVANGDIAIVAIAAEPGVVVTPPDTNWTQIAQTDPSQFGIVAFWTTVLNAPANWVFSLNGSNFACGVVAIYGNVDGFNPIDMSTVAVNSVSAGDIPSVTASLNGEELAIFLVASGNGSFTPSGNYQQAASKSTVHVSISFQHQALQSAGTQPATTSVYSGSAAGACIAITLAPSYSTLTQDDIYHRLFDAMPEGIDNLLDFTPTGDFYKYFQVIAAVAKIGFDLVDILRQEIVPYLSRYKLPDWERIFGLLSTITAQTGTIPSRQSQVLGAWRAAAGQGASIPTVQAVLRTLLGYSAATTPLVIECDRPTLTLVNSYDATGGGDVAIPHAATTTLTIPVSDGGKVAKMGAQLELAFASTPLTTYTFVLTAPDGSSKTWTGTWGDLPLVLYAPSFAGAKTQGNWTLAITNGSGVDNTLYSAAFLFVEGMARGQQTAGAIFDWGVWADPAHIGESGTANFAAARAAIKKLALSHTIGNLIQSLAPWPDSTTAPNAAIPDECIPT